MNIKPLALTTGIAISGIIASGSVTPASAFTFDLSSFAEDTNANGGQNFTTLSHGAETNFLNKLTGLTGNNTQNFDSVTPNTFTPYFTLGKTLTTADFPGTSSITTTSTDVAQTSTTTFATKGVRVNDTTTTPTANGRFAISDSNYYEVGNGTFTITFDTRMAAIGFYATDVEDLEGIILQFDKDFTNPSVDPAKTLTIPRTVSATDKSALYYGFVAADASETFTSVTFGRALSDSNDKFGLDNLTFATPSQVKSFASTAVPEPFTIVGTLIGGGAALRMRKKLKSSAKATE
jgi:hypothetical protein